jgi:RNA polymerase sigma-70 factor (ECF subfamily)
MLRSGLDVDLDPDRAFLEVLVSTQGRIRSYVAGMGVPLSEVDDIAQEVYLIYYRDQARRPADVPPLAWLRGIARNRCQLYLRSTGRSGRKLEALGNELARHSTPPEADGPSDDRVLVTLARCLEKLPERYRTMLTWYYTEQLSAEEIGKRLARSAGAVRVAMLRVREALRACVDEAAPEPEGT